MLFLAIIQLGIILIFFILGWVLLKKKAYWLVSGFATRPKAEQQQLIENGYLQKTGKLLILTALGMLILLPLHLTSFNYTVEIQFGIMVLILFAGSIYLSKFEVPRKRKRSYIISISLSFIVIAFVAFLLFLGYRDYQLVMKNNSFEITGVYGEEWSYQDVEHIELLKEMPKVITRQNGFGLSTIAKGKFLVKDYGSSLLFIRKNISPYLYIETSNKKIFMNAKTPEQTERWYDDLHSKTGR